MTAVLGKGAKFRFKARGTSMTPFVLSGDLITITPQRKKTIQVGKIVAFRRPEDEKVVVHRVVAVSAINVLINGDDQPRYSDGWVAKENIIGEVTRIERNGRSVWLGLGFERYLIAFLSRKGWLPVLRSRISSVRHHKSKGQL